MDIRNWFSPINKKNPISDQLKEKKRKKIIESDDEDPVPSKPQKQKVLASDSDDDIFDVTPKSMKPAIKESKVKAEVSKPVKSLPKPSPSKLKPKAPSDFFGDNPVSYSKKSSKRKSNDSVSDLQSLDAFERTLQQIDEINRSKRLKKDDHSKHNGNSSSSSRIIDQNGKKGLASKLSEKMRENKVIKPSKERDSSKSPLKKEITGESETREVKKVVSSKSPLKREMKEEPEKYEIRKGITSESPIKGEVKEEPETNEIKKVSSKSPLKREIKEKPKESRVNTPKKASTVKVEKLKKKLTKTHKIEITPAKEKVSKSEIEELTPVDELKKQRSMAYRKFINRSGPSNPGSKIIPEGKPNCLSGMTFVITGVLDSIDRYEAAEIVKKYGGRVTTSVSKNTTYLILGEEPGASKTAKADQLGTKTIDEDGFLNLIETRSSKISDDSPSDKGKEKKEASSKLSKFQRETKGASKFSKSSNQMDSSDSPVTPRSLSSLSSPSSIKSSPSSKSSSQNTEPISSQDLLMRSSEELMFVDKYKPTTLKNIIGQQGEQSNAKKLLNWLKNWTNNRSSSKKLVRPGPWVKDNTGAYFKAALLSGPPGVGKTTTAGIVSKELGFDVVEMNASDTRSKRALAEEVAELLTNMSLSGYVNANASESTSRNHVLLMDEVDGMAGNEDRGGVQELIGLIKTTRVPVICMCNDRNHPKIRSLSNHCFDLRFQRPRVEQIRGAMMSVCFREGIKVKPEALDQMITGSNQDIRQVLHHLSMWSADQKILDTDVVKKESKMAKKDFKIGPWDVCTKVFSESAHKEMTIHDKVSLFFHDYSIGPLFIQENYLKVSPHCARGNRNKLLEQIAKTSKVLADSDIIDKAIRSQSAWSLLPTQALFSSVCPGQYMEGHFSAQVEFPRWLGNNSKKNKMDRLSQEILTHMRLRISASKQDIITDYSSRLRDAIVEPLSSKGADGVRDAVDAMISNDLLREDLDSILELSTWPGAKDKMTNVESKVKAAFTRTLNKESHMTPFSNVNISKKSAATVDEFNMLDEEENADDEDEEDDDVSKDNMIKLGKHSQKKAEPASKAGESSKGKGRGKGKGKK